MAEIRKSLYIILSLGERMVKRSELQKISDKAALDTGYSRKLMTDFDFAQRELSKAEMTLTQEQFNALKSLHQQAMPADDTAAASCECKVSW